MGKLDDPKERILRLFEMEERERGGYEAERFEDGIRPDGLPLDGNEAVYGVFKERYFFTPISLIIRDAKGFTRIPWSEVATCSSEHGTGDRFSLLTLVDCTEYRVRIADFGTGWSGRVSQLFHQLIERHGAAAALGPPVVTVEKFFGQATDPFSFLPNLEPHPTLEESRAALQELAAKPGVTGVWLQLCDPYASSMEVNSLIVAGDASVESLESFGRRLGADGVVDADANCRRKVGCTSEEIQVRLIVWD